MIRTTKGQSDLVLETRACRQVKEVVQEFENLAAQRVVANDCIPCALG